MKTKLLTAILVLALCIGCKKGDTSQPNPDPVPVPIDYKQKASTIKTTISGIWYYQAYDVKYFDSRSALIYDDIASPTIIYNENAYTFTDNGAGSSNYVVKSELYADSLLTNGYGYKILSYNSTDLVFERISSKTVDNRTFVNTTTGALINSTYIQSTTHLGRTK